MSEKHLNIVSFDVPLPANYGGVIDVFYKIKALHKLGVKIHLHCFDYGRGTQADLEQYCASVKYYKRREKKLFLLSSLPYIVASRLNNNIVKDLCQNNYPILFEGLHTCGTLADIRLDNRTKFVRTHNIEHDYYKGLANVEKKTFKRIYFKREAKKLRKFEGILNLADKVFAISNEDAKYLSSKYNNVDYLPVFHPAEKVEITPGKGNFALYHGNLSVGENNEAAIFLATKVFNDLDYPLIIAGSNPSEELVEICKQNDKIELKAKIDSKEIEQLVADTHVNVLPTFQSTGIKLKLLLALFKGRFCIANNEMILNTGIETLCEVSNSEDEWKNAIKKVFNKEFDTKEIDSRKDVLENNFSNDNSIKILFNSI